MTKFLLILLYCVLINAETISVKEVTNGNNLFAGDLYSGIIKENKENIIISPFSLETVLALTAEGAGGNTAKEFQSTLHLPKPEDVHSGYEAILKNFNIKSNVYELLTANKIYVAQGFSIKKSFKDIAINIYKSDIQNVNFTDSVNTANKINQWVENQTDSKIKNLISPANINGLTRLILINTLYFQGTWQKQFNTNETFDSDFFVEENKPISVKTMHMYNYVLVAQCAEYDAKFINLPYKGPNISMTIVLPNTVNGLSKLEKNIKNILALKLDYSRGYYNLKLPKFSIEGSYNLNSVLENNGLKSAFDANTANFSEFGNNKEQLYISDVIQKAFINVTERGTEAGAASGVSIGILSLPPDLFIDRPFLFYISLNDLLLFVGRVLNPNK